MTTTRAAVCTGLNEPWKTEEIEIDPPGNREIRVKMVYAGSATPTSICGSVRSPHRKRCSS